MNVSGLNIDLYNRSNWVAIIGSREASEAEQKTACQLAITCVRKGKIVVSGLAKNIDEYAHKGAIYAGGKTIAIVNTLINEPIYPRENSNLAKKIRENGCIIHPYTTKAKPKAKDEKGLSQFSKRLIERDLLVAWLCPVIVAVKDSNTPITGGTKWAVGYGMEYGKKVYRVDNSFVFHENPKVESRKISWIPELNVKEFEPFRSLLNF